MATRPRLRPHLTAVPHSADVVELRHGGWSAESYTLSDSSGGGTLAGVVERLDGTRTVTEVAREVGVSRRDVEGLLDHLTGLDLLEEGPTTALDAYVARAAQALLPFGGGAATDISDPVVLGSSPVARRVAELLGESLAAAGTGVRAEDDGELLTLAGRPEMLTDPVALAAAAEAFDSWRDRLVVAPQESVRPHVAVLLNRLAHRCGFTWLHAVVDGPSLVVGPLTVPGRSACYECFEARVAMNLRESVSYLRYKTALAQGRTAGSPPEVEPVLGAMLAAHTAAEALNLLLTGTTFTVGKALSIYLPTMELTWNEVLRLPGCPACGPVEYAQDEELFFDVRAILDGA